MINLDPFEEDTTYLDDDSAFEQPLAEDADLDWEDDEATDPDVSEATP